MTSECTPFARTGGLGDAVAGLSKSLRRLGHDVRILLPLYGSIDRAQYRLQFVASAGVHMGNQVEHWIGIHRGLLEDEVPVWFVDYEAYFGRGGFYGDSAGDYTDNAFRFALLSKAAIQICKDRQFAPHVIHSHDWQAALVPAFLKTWDRILSPLSETASVLTIHNIGYQGVYDAGVFPYIGIGAEHFTADKIEDHGRVNLLKAGIAFADALNTVSPTHAREIRDPEGGMGLAPYLNNRQADLVGILNGVDYERWNPEVDRLIPARYTAKDLSGKIVCKATLQERFNLEIRPNIPVIGIVSRFAWQKGFHLIRNALPAALHTMTFQCVVLGSGDADTEDFFRLLQSAYPGRVGAVIGFSDELSHLIEAGSDFFLMPSLYEPCGLNQIYSLRYGTLPIVRATGGLDDTVENYDEATGAGTGFKFIQPTPLALHNTIGWAISTWFDRPHHITQLRNQAMAKRFDWADSAKQYVELYQRARRNRLATP